MFYHELGGKLKTVAEESLEVEHLKQIILIWQNWQRSKVIR